MPHVLNMVSYCQLITGIVLALTTSALAADWSYRGLTGPGKWGETYAECDKTEQSPINIFEGDVAAGAISDPITYNRYETVEGINMKYKNTGHGAQVDLSGANLPAISDGGLPGNFQAAQFHFHWAAEQMGSEHTVSNKGFPGELHIVHWNTKYASIGEAVDKTDGLAVLGIMIEVGLQENPVFAQMISKVGNILTPDSAPVGITTIALSDLMPTNREQFYRYKGSLTTPPCYQSVTWTVFKNSIKISKDQLNSLFDLRDSKGDFILDNARPVMPVNGRTVASNFDSVIHWGYQGKYGVEHWEDYYESCGADSQSPVNIPSGAATFDNSMPSFVFQNFDQTTDIVMNMANNGHTIKVDITGTNAPKVSGGGLTADRTFNVAQFHMHWGSTSKMGSEHTVDYKMYPMELHIVTWDSFHSTFPAAVKAPKGLAVLGFFFEISNADNADFAPFIEMAKTLKNEGDKGLMTTVSLDSFLPADRGQFYRYDGSLTTPGCFETVIWTVFNSKIEISEAQMDVLRSLISNEKDETTNILLPMVNNFRPVLPLNSRSIKRNFQVQPKDKVEWTYFGATGTQNWNALVPMCNSTKRQSPIDILPQQVQFKIFDDFKFKNFDTKVGVAAEIMNNGHAVVVNYKSGDLMMSGGGLDGEYKVAQFHFHWGSKDTQGSEHTIDGKQWPMELHIVTYNALYSSIGLAMTQSNGLAVLGFMFEVSEVDNAAYAPMFSKLSKINKPKQEATLDAFSLNSLLPKTKSTFYRYLGSLTTPTCDESVTWTVFEHTIPISTNQLNQLRLLESSEKDDKSNMMPLVDNFRPVQPIGDRQVYANFYVSSRGPAGTDAGSVLLASIWTTLASLALFLGHRALV